MENKSIILRQEEIQFISNNLELPKNLRNIFDTKNYKIKISEEEADILRDLCGEKLQQVGFDENYNLNEVGNMLEYLIDKLFMD